MLPAAGLDVLTIAAVFDPEAPDPAATPGGGETPAGTADAVLDQLREMK